jgi:hypothetical protein
LDHFDYLNAAMGGVMLSLGSFCVLLQLLSPLSGLGAMANVLVGSLLLFYNSLKFRSILCNALPESIRLIVFDRYEPSHLVQSPQQN